MRLRLRESRAYLREHIKVCVVTSALASAMTYTPVGSDLNLLFYLRYPLLRDAPVLLAYFRKIGRQLKAKSKMLA